jgi:hypothetical protein
MSVMDKIEVLRIVIFHTHAANEEGGCVPLWPAGTAKAKCAVLMLHPTDAPGQYSISP